MSPGGPPSADLDDLPFGANQKSPSPQQDEAICAIQVFCVGLGTTMWTVLPEGETRGRHARQSPTIREADPPRETEPARKPTPKHGPRALIGQIRYRGPDARGDTVPSLRHPSGTAPRRAGVASGLAKTLGGSRHLFGIGVMRGSSLLASRARLSGTLTRDLSGTPPP